MANRLPSVALLTAFAGALAAAASAQPGQPVGQPSVRPVAMENPAALASFARALRALEADSSRRVRVFHYGDSNVAADLWTAVVRRRLQARYGDGGSGYLLPTGHGSVHRGSAHVVSHGHWATRRHGFARQFGRVDGLWGLAGVAVEAAQVGARLDVELPLDAGPHELELHLLGRPRGGTVELRVEPDVLETLELEADAPRLVLHRRALRGQERPSLVARRGRARVLGVVVERPSGLVYDVLGINGHRASAMLLWNAELLREQLAQRRPDLVVLGYGGNEALTLDLPLPTYEARTFRAVGRMRGLAPQASCLLVGPLATFPEHEARMRAITQIQRRIAPAMGCAFWDSSQVSGGHGRLQRWARFPGMVAGDRLHFGRLGYERVGEAFVRALLGAVDAPR